MRPWFHRHLSRERYELALEADPKEAGRIRALAGDCPVCQEALTPYPLTRRLAGQPLPSLVASPVDWRRALTRAIAPITQPRSRRRTAAWRGLVLVGALAAILTAIVVPAGAAGPHSVLYPVRGIAEDVVWSTTQPAQRPRLEADQTATYLWQARLSSERRDTVAYQASMTRVILWADRLKADVKESPQSDRAAIGASVSAGSSLLPELKSSPANQEQDQAGQVKSILGEVEGQVREGDGDHGGGG
jgi:hypothetical protein